MACAFAFLLTSCNINKNVLSLSNARNLTKLNSVTYSQFTYPMLQESSNESFELMDNAACAYFSAIEYFGDNYGLFSQRSDWKYIAIDLSNQENLSVNAKGQLLQKLTEKYGITFQDTTFEQLEKSGYIKDDKTYSCIDGAILKITKADIDDEFGTFDLGIYESTKGGYYIENVVVEKKEGWKVISAGVENAA